MISRRILQLGGAAALALAMSGCALLKSPSPVQLYRFGLPMDAPSAQGDRPAPLTVSIRNIDFPEASGDDRLLGVTGVETAYISGARWVSPASTLFDDSLKAAFANRADRIRVLGRREPGTPPLVLQVTVTAFEARYAAPGATPDVVVTARAQLRSTPERQTGGGGAIRPEQGRSVERVFTVTQPAGENRVSAIVAAFDTATRDINTQIADWTIQSAN
ncbi:ABC-type transport auxiliary lipoprotein family protein [Brevundimonas sp. SORGH_AS_0993]|uniref:ABC-type transport auxiliary lipoprotein family protein n=1 Tax=Brevundimonas sp. SORGH_AS_0993 TaxID=3041794 RepID=UPI00278153CC|nr:ABC-type transport auxiliary lipoprotein family protein [Brevundimonas sp. SORGH_AS_0993]MDQ1153014.1 cholesterol transport system auxiliary component [Brevundimonas sp. SORGH_AS_0993]